MRAFEILTTIFATTTILCSAQHGADPAYLQQYYQQVASQAGHRAAAGAAGGAGYHQEATPIFEQNSEQQQQYISQGQQIRLKDNSQDQARAQAQQQQSSSRHTQAYVAPSVREYLQHQQPQQVQYVQPQPLAYKQSGPKQQLLRRPSQDDYQGGKLAKEEDDYDHNPSYQFGFDVKDDEFTNYQNRKEVRDGNVIKGSYSVVDSDGFIRTVKYTADPKEGFKAEVIREPTDIVVKIPTPAPQQLLRHQDAAGPQQYLSHKGQGQAQYYQQ